MILADKIIMLRKKNGWSQEELADKMDVSRQSVSKWEGAQSVPDLGRILQLSRIFGVSTDYLLKDEIEIEEPLQGSGDEALIRRVSMEEAAEFLATRKHISKRIALGVFLCILSPICLILLSVASETGRLSLNENAAAGIGISVLLVMVAAAVAIFITSGFKASRFEYMEKEIFETEYGVTGMVKEKKTQYQGTYTFYIVLGICLCILSVLPLFAGMAFTENEFVLVLMVSLLLFLAGIGVFCLVMVGIVWGSMQILLQEGDYSKQKKAKNSLSSLIASIYWLVATAVFLIYSFTTGNWGKSWIVWPAAGVLFAIIMTVCNAVDMKKKSE